ncbi:MAG: helix-turn-helix domain-containing protein [Candidatus Thiodiazotropha taylori]|nr:helix-turn-helix domain-containing protein [Candidatus Thiodiazotropha taylori]
MSNNLKNSLEETYDFLQGKQTGGKASYYPPPEVNVYAIRHKLGYSQEEFANKYGFSLGTLRNWEQGRRQPEGPARVLLKVIEKNHKAVEMALCD